MEHADMKQVTDWGDEMDRKKRNMGTHKVDEQQAKLKVIHKGHDRLTQETENYS